MIAFIGSVFSPWYRWAGRRRPHDHACINVATYGPGGRFCMTERGERHLEQTAQSFRVGPSALRWDGQALTVDVDEVSNPHLTRLRGQIRLVPAAVTGVEVPLDAAGAHVWRPFAPAARIEVDLDRPGWRWQGHGYLDANFGTRALEADFRYWTWARMPLDAGRAAAFYDAERRDGGRLSLALEFGADGAVREMPAAPPLQHMRRSLWTVRRAGRAEAGHRPRQVMAMLDAPFYSRSVVEARLEGAPRRGVHEALDLDRFASRWIKPMLALRVPRVR